MKIVYNKLKQAIYNQARRESDYPITSITCTAIIALIIITLNIIICNDARSWCYKFFYL